MSRGLRQQRNVISVKIKISNDACSSSETLET